MADLGLTPGQLANAERIISIGKSRGMSSKDIETAIAVALAESNLQNYANSSIPESMRIPHDAVGSDHKSVGVFQQQVGIWGNAPDLMNLDKSANLFYDALAKVAGRDAMSVPQAAQTVQRSAFADGSNYAKQLDLARQITGALPGSSSGSKDVYDTGSKTVVDPLKWIMDSGNQKRIALYALGAAIIIIAAVKLFSGNKTLKLATSLATKGIVK